MPFCTQYEGNLLEVLLTPSQRHYYTAMKKLGRKKPRKVIKRPSNSFLSLFYDISMSRRYVPSLIVIWCRIIASSSLKLLLINLGSVYVFQV